ncbi:hypothetical protein LWV33_03190 [Brucella intermedia]
MTTLPEEAVTSAAIIQVITDLRLAILQDDDEGLAEHAEPMVKAKELIAKLSASPFLPVQGAVNIDAIVQPLEDIHAPGGLCRWTDVATAIGEVRRALSALEPSAARNLALEEAARECEKRGAVTSADAIRSLSSPDHADAGKLVNAARNLIANRFDTYKARNGKLCSIEGDDGEKCWIVPFDDMAELEAALRSHPSSEVAGS